MHQPYSRLNEVACAESSLADGARSPQTPRQIPRSQFARIRTLVKYGMTVGQVAEVYRFPLTRSLGFSAKG